MPNSMLTALARPAFALSRRLSTRANALPATASRAPVNAGKHAPSPSAKKTGQPPKSVSPKSTHPASTTLLKTKTTSENAGQHPPAPEQREKTTDEQLAEIEQLMTLSYNYPTLDPWGQAMHTLDVQIPYVISLTSRGVSWTTVWDRIKANILDNFKNAASMYRMASADAFPGVDLSRSGRIDKLFRWPPRLFQCRSVNSNAWIAGIRSQVLDSYVAVNKAVSAQDSKAVKRLTLASYQDSTMKLVRKRSGSDVYVWRLHAEGQGDAHPLPARVLSLRATEGYLAKDEPKLGNRLVVHALVKFDTKQSLQIYSKNGELLSSQKPKRVVEYLVLEKRMWYDVPWMIREQIFETPGVHV